MEGELNVEDECKNCNHAIAVHAGHHDLNGEHECSCEKPQYYGAIISNKYLDCTEFHCNNCGKLIGF